MVRPTFGADDMKRNDSVWVWDGCWLPGVVTDAVLEQGEGLVIVRLESGCSAPARGADLRPRDPEARGSDRPGSHRHGRSPRRAA